MLKRTLIRNATVITVDPKLGDLDHGDILIEGSKIAAVGTGLEAGGAEIIDGTGTIVMPGMVDTHRHVWQTTLRNIAADWTLDQYFAGVRGQLGEHFCAEDMYTSNLAGACEALNAGITTVLDWSHNDEHAGAHRRRRQWPARFGRPLRHVLRQFQRRMAAGQQPADLARRVPRQAGILLRCRRPGADGHGAARAAVCDRIRDDRRLGAGARHRRADLRARRRRRVGQEPSGGVARATGPARRRGLRALQSRLRTTSSASRADHGAWASMTPDIELQMGHGWPATGRLIKAGLAPTLGVDIVTSNSGHLFQVMRTVLLLERAWAHHHADQAGTTVQRLPIDTSDVLAFATINGARALGMEDRIGSLTPGKQADLCMLRADNLEMAPLNNPVGAVVLAGHPGLVDSVWVAGKAVKRHGKLVNVDVARLIAELERSRDRVLALAGVAPGGRFIPAPYQAAH
ncbi:amidohydrolase family protein [Cupriavidus basilensis]